MEGLVWLIFLLAFINVIYRLVKAKRIRTSNKHHMDMMHQQQLQINETEFINENVRQMNEQDNFNMSQHDNHMNNHHHQF